LSPATVIDAVLMKSLDSIEEEESTIVASMLGKKAVNLVYSMKRESESALDHQSVSLNAPRLLKSYQRYSLLAQAVPIE
jgi:hypothetical protein